MSKNRPMVSERPGGVGGGGTFESSDLFRGVHSAPPKLF